MISTLGRDQFLDEGPGIYIIGGIISDLVGCRWQVLQPAAELQPHDVPRPSVSFLVVKGRPIPAGEHIRPSTPHSIFHLRIKTAKNSNISPNQRTVPFLRAQLKQKGDRQSARFTEFKTRTRNTEHSTQHLGTPGPCFDGSFPGSVFVARGSPRAPTIAGSRPVIREGSLFRRHSRTIPRLTLFPEHRRIPTRDSGRDLVPPPSPPHPRPVSRARPRRYGTCCWATCSASCPPSAFPSC